MLMELLVAVSLLTFLWISLFEMLRGYLKEVEQGVQQEAYMDRINKEKYLDEAGCNYMNDPW